MGHRDHGSRGCRLGHHVAWGRGRQLGAERRLPDRFLCRHARHELRPRPHARSDGRASGRRRTCFSSEDRFLGQHEPRGPDADERGPRTECPPARHEARRQAGEDGHSDSRVGGRPHRHRRRDSRLLTVAERSSRARARSVRYERPHRRCGGPHAAARHRQGASARVGDEGIHEATLHRRQRPHPADPPQSSEQRSQVHRLGVRRHQCRGCRAVRRDSHSALCAGYGGWHSRGIARQHLHTLPPEQRKLASRGGRQRFGACDHQAPRRSDGGNARGDEQAERRNELPGGDRPRRRARRHPARR